jgi:hypothetical protein
MGLRVPNPDPRTRPSRCALAASALAALAACSSGAGDGADSGESSQGAGAGGSAPSSSTATSSAEASGTGSSTGASGATGGGAPARALVYWGPGTCDARRGGCSAAWAEMFQHCQPGFEIEYVGPGQAEDVTPAALAHASVFIYPGGNDDLTVDWQEVKSYKAAIQAFVQAGGRYLGACTGGYLAASNPWTGESGLGFELLPADADEYIVSANADPTTPDDTVTQVVWPSVWGREPHPIYFQDGPLFRLHDDGSSAAVVLATYASNGEIGALVASYGAGKVGVMGPHAEAPEDWYTFNDVPGEPDFAPGCDLIAKTLAP